jgi:hypothetical protein
MRGTPATDSRNTRQTPTATALSVHRQPGSDPGFFYLERKEVMSTLIIRTLLSGAADLGVPDGQILSGAPQPKPAALPALYVAELACAPEPSLAGRGEAALVTARVQVTAVSAGYDQTKTLLAAVRRACHLQSGRIADLDVVSVVRGQTGPDASDDGTFRQALEFGVTYYEAD